MTVHEDAAAALLDRFLDDPAGSRALSTYRSGLATGQWSEDYAEVIGQYHQERRRLPLEQVAAFASVHSGIMGGDTARMVLGTHGNTPSADKDRAANAAALSDLPHPFVADVDQAQANDDQDGWLEWTEPIDVEVSTGVPLIAPDGSLSPVILVRKLPPGRVPLEIGTTAPSVTLAHLWMQRGVARWPYGHHLITLLMNVGEPWQRQAGL